MKNKSAADSASSHSCANASARLVVSKTPAKKTEDELAMEECQRQYELAMENH